METDLARLLASFDGWRPDDPLVDRMVRSTDPWDLDLAFTLAATGPYRARTLRSGDEPALHALGELLGARSRHFFCPYPWGEPGELDRAFTRTIQRAHERIDASYLLLHGEAPVAHFFLWRAGGNPVSQRWGVQVPELGVAVADACQGRGFGRLAVRLLNALAARLGAHAVELTTALDNASGYRTYVREGYVPVGVIRNPLDVDVTAAMAGEVKATRFRDEHQMIYVIVEAARPAVLRHLAQERLDAQSLGG